MAYKNQQIFSGYDSYLKIIDIISEARVKKPLLVVDNAYDNLFIKGFIDSLETQVVLFKDFKPNPLYEDIVKGVNLFNDEKCDFIISIGGGSAIDVAKCIKLFSTLSTDRVYLEQEYSDSLISHLAIPTTAGTGSESTRYAVCYYKGEKQSITHESIIPDYVILEPKFLETLPVYQKKSTLLDALCQSIESIWSVNSTDESIEFSKTAIRMILANIEPYFKNERSSLENVCVAANLAGRAINITQTTAAHAMSYKITSLCGLSHGHAVAVCLPYIWRYMIENISHCSDPRGKEQLEKSFDILDELFFVDEHKQAVYRFFRILKLFNLDFPTLNKEENIESFVASVNPVRLKNNPVSLDEAAIKEIYNYIFNNGNKFATKNISKFLKKYNTFYEISELQTYSLEALKAVDALCKKHNIKYFLAEGTLLGAVRHNGFIPWDDDIDICMKRDEYDRFIRIAAEELNQDYVLDSFETNPNHWTICAKVFLTRNTKFHNKRLEGIALSTSPGIDVFPLDNAPQSKSELDRIGNLVKIYRVMLWLKTGYSHDYSSYKRIVLKFLSLFFSVSKLAKKIDSLLRSYNNYDSNELVNYGSLYNPRKECFSSKLFKAQKFVKFEEETFPIPVGYDEMLTKIYGDYKTLPPFSKRFPKHSFFVDKNF